MCPPEAYGVEKRFWASWVTVQCPCGQIWPVQKMDVRKTIRRCQHLYCSPECMATGIGNTLRTRTCVVCGGPAKRNGAATCSPDCLAKYRARNHIEKGCPQCGLMFRPKGSRTQYCSRDCANQAHALRMIGRGNSHFKTGTSYAKWFRSMRPLILQRDGEKCVACSETPVIAYVRNGKPVQKSGLVIHHLNEKPWDNTAENLITLCFTCHAVHHKSSVTPFPWFAEWAARESMSMTSKWKERVTSLQAAYSSTTV